MASEEVTDWRVGLSHREKLKYMLTGKYATDVTFRFGHSENEECIQAHRAILICGSPVFDRMLKQTSAMKQEQDIQIDDTDPEAFKQMLRYLYCEEIDFKDGDTASLLQIAKKYDIASLEKACSTFLRLNISDDNACSLLNKAIEIKDEELAQTCVHHIAVHAEDIFKSDDFVKLSQKSLLKVIENNRLRYGDEVEVLQACIAWAEAQCKQSKESVSDEVIRKKLGDVLYQIRFPTMTGKEFSGVSRKYSILTASERVEIYDSIMQEDKSATTCPSGSLFNEAPRIELSPKPDESEFREGKKIFSRCFWDRPVTLRLCTDNSLIIEGVFLLRSITPVTKQVRIQILDGEDAVADTGMVSMFDKGLSRLLVNIINDKKKEEATSDSEDCNDEDSDDDNDEHDADANDDDDDGDADDDEDDDSFNKSDFALYINFPTPPVLLPDKTYVLKSWVSGGKHVCTDTFTLPGDVGLKAKRERSKNSNLFNVIHGFQCRSMLQ